MLPVASVQNRYNLTDRAAEEVLVHCETAGLAFIPWYPIASGGLAGPGGVVAEIAAETGATPAQVALAWLLGRSPVMVPIPGTKSVAHAEENCEAATLILSGPQTSRLDAADPGR